MKPGPVLSQRESVFEEAFLFERRIDEATYERQRDKVREEIAFAEMAAQDARLDELDVDGLLAFAEHVLTNAARLWIQSSVEYKTRLQEVLFPEGLRVKDGEFGTATTSFAFLQLQEDSAAQSGLASPTGTVISECWPLAIEGYADLRVA